MLLHGPYPVVEASTFAVAIQTLVQVHSERLTKAQRSAQAVSLEPGINSLQLWNFHWLSYEIPFTGLYLLQICSWSSPPGHGCKNHKLRSI